jgi:Zn-dependent peptidase ImmA (M78 family)
MNIRFARMQAERLVERLGFDKSLPIDVTGIARLLGLEVTEAGLGEDVSGLLIANTNTAHIFINESNPEVRKRFTIGHEIGHFYLRHQFESGDHVHVDRGGYYISQRGPKASKGLDPKEIEANQFSACLLMPSKLIMSEVAKLGTNNLSDYAVEKLAKSFQVSEQAMTIRLTTLGLLD